MLFTGYLQFKVFIYEQKCLKVDRPLHETVQFFL